MDATTEDDVVDLVCDIFEKDIGHPPSCLFPGFTNRLTEGFTAHRANGIPIESGHVFMTTADDPNDLPSVELLQLRWAFSQVAALAGFSNMTDVDWAEDDDADNGLSHNEDEHECSDDEQEDTIR